MIHTSDGESFENEVHHVFGHDLMADKQAPQAPTEPAGESKSDSGTQVALNKGSRENKSSRETYDELFNSMKEGEQTDPATYMRVRGINIPTGEISASPSLNIIQRNTNPTLLEKVEDTFNNLTRIPSDSTSRMSKDVGVSDIETLGNKAKLKHYGERRLEEIDGAERWKNWLKETPR